MHKFISFFVPLTKGDAFRLAAANRNAGGYFTLNILLIGLFFIQTIHAQDTLTIFHINDTHSYVYPWGPKVNGVPQNGAAARLVQRLNVLRDSSVNPLLLHGGDSFTGDLIFNRFLGRAEFELFNEMGMTAMALGNHDFDIRPFRLKNAIVESGAMFDILSANIQYNADTSGLDQYVKPFVVKNIGGLDVGIFGLTTRTTTSYGETESITFASTTGTAQSMVDSLTARNVDVIIAVTHLGVSEDRRIAQNVAGIDVIVGGHSHTPLEEPVLEINPAGDSTIIVQAGSKWRYLGMLTLILTDSTKSWSYQLDQIDAPLDEDAVFTALLDAYRDSINATYNNPYSDTVAVLTAEFPENNFSGGNPESPLVNLVTDAYVYATNADAALEVSSLMRQSLYAGAISTAELRQTLSWAYDSVHNLGKRITLVEMTGSMFHFMLNSAQQLSSDFFGGGGGGLAFQTSGLQYTISSLGFVEDVWINNEPLDLNKVYRIALNEFVADLAGEVSNGLIQFISRVDTAFGADEAMKQYLGSLGEFDAGIIQMGRVWNASSTAALTFTSTETGVLIDWANNPDVVSYNIRRKLGTAPFANLNADSLTTTEFFDTTTQRGVSYYYQLEEIRTNGLSYLQPPVSNVAPVLPTTSYILPNYPNPFNRETTIVFGIPAPARVAVRVYNVLGQEVKTLLDAERARGEFQVRWAGDGSDGSPAASGMYIVRMLTPSSRHARAIILVR
ncbi:MAG: 5'-nucleotidase C-terminal domain-containing protein [Ignavibacteriae bacterium]|nr:5'-nucleotidase C-terminal domain-containing protein [Ignavibacteriota bacterium]